MDLPEEFWDDTYKESSWEYLGLEWKDTNSDWAQMKNAAEEQEENKKVLARCLRNNSGLWREDQAVLFQELSENEVKQISRINS